MIYNLYEKWQKIPQFFRFLFIGGINTLIGYTIFVIAILLLGQIHYQICVALQWVLSSVTSYINQKIFVFGTKGNYLKEYIKCCSTWALSYCINAISLEIFVRYLIKNVYISQIISMVLASIVTYFLFKYFAFKNKQF